MVTLHHGTLLCTSTLQNFGLFHSKTQRFLIYLIIHNLSPQLSYTPCSIIF
ncbi:hypothetical protein KSS87_006775 [Heliosperma pusillum]|nr:hypothetical protein KSS87_006775 [Heliosperma pusillum]